MVGTDTNNGIDNNGEESSNSVNQHLMDSFKAMMNEGLLTMRVELERNIEERLRRTPRSSDAENYYSQSSRSHQSRRRRPQEDQMQRNLQTNPRDPLAGLKIKIPSFLGTNDPEEYLEWEKKIEIVFECREYTQDSKVKVAPTAFKDYALSWWDQLVTSRRRVGDLPIDSWNQMKAIMRRRFIPSHYHRELHFRLRNLTQGTRTVEEYFKEMETLMLRADIREDSEATMARFMGGLNREIIDRLEVQHYVELEELLHKAIMFEKQLKRKPFKSGYGNLKSGYENLKSGYENLKSGYENLKSGNGTVKSSYQKEDYKTFSKHKVEDQKLKEKERPTSSKTRELKCFKCKGSGHYASECPNKRTIIIRENGELESEDEHAEPETKEEQVVMPVSGELLVARRTLNLKAKDDENSQRENLFHTRCNVQGKVCSMVIDGGSCTNVASETMVEKLGLTVQKRPLPYKLQWLNDEGELEVENQVLVPFSIGAYEDEVLCDVLPMDAGHILLGRPWQSDRKVMHDGYTNKYSFEFKGKKIVLVPLTPQEVYQDQLSLKKNSVRTTSKPPQPSKPPTKQQTNLMLQQPKGSSSTSSLVISKYCWLNLPVPKQAVPSRFELSLQEIQEDNMLENSPPLKEFTQEQAEPNTLKEKLTQFLTLSLPVFTKTFEITFNASSVGISFVLMQGNTPIAYFKDKYSLCPKEFVPHIDQDYIQKLKEQPSLTNEPVRWTDFMVTIPKVIKLKNGAHNVFPGARYVLLTSLESKLLGIEQIKSLYASDSDLGKDYATCEKYANCSIYNCFLSYGNYLGATNLSLSNVSIEEAPGEADTKGQPRINKRIRNHAYHWDLKGKRNMSSSFDVSNSLSFLAGKTDLRTNPFQVGEDDVILTSKGTKETREPKEQLGPEKKRAKKQLVAKDIQAQEPEAAHLSSGPLIKPKAKEFHQAFHKLLSLIQGNLELANPITLIVTQAT